MSAIDDYERDRPARVGLRARVARDMAARLAWPRDRVEAFRLASLKRLLAFAREHSAWHRGRLHGVDIDALTLDRLDRIPPMTKADLMANWDAIVTRPGMTLAAAEDHLALVASDGRLRYFDGDCHVTTSSGTSGLRGVHVFDADAWATYTSGATRGMDTAIGRLTVLNGRRPSVSVIAADKPTHPTAATVLSVAPPSAALADRIIPSTAPLAEIVASLNARRPEVLVCYASLVPSLVEEARERRLDIPLQLLAATAEHLRPEAAEAAMKQWSLLFPVLNSWVSVETTGAFACLAGSDSHLSDDLNVFELVAEDGRPTPAGDASDRILVTVLYIRLLPLIRYEITDSFRMIPGPCRCGSTFPRAEVLGRTEAFAYGAVRVHPALFMVPLLDDRHIKQFAIRQTGDGADIDVVAPALVPADLVRLAEVIRRDLAAIGVPRPVVHVRQVSTIPLAPSGKTASFVPLPADPTSGAATR